MKEVPRLFVITRYSVCGILLLIIFGFVRLLNRDEDWELGTSYAFIFYLFTFLYYLVLLSVSFYTKRNSVTMLVFAMALTPLLIYFFILL